MNSFDIEFVLRQLRNDREFLKLSRQRRGTDGWKLMFLELLELMRSNMSLYYEGYETDSWDKLIVIVKNWDGSEVELEHHLRLIMK